MKLHKVFHRRFRLADNKATSGNKCLDLETCDYSVISQTHHSSMLGFIFLQMDQTTAAAENKALNFCPP